MAAYTTIDNPELYFQCKLFTGTGSSNAITLDGEEDMQPDLVIVKRRNSAGGNMYTDSVRGVQETIISNEDSAEQTFSNGLTAFGSDGFTVGSESGFNNSSDTFVAWCWKAGTTWSNDASATSIGSLDSNGSKNATSKFSVFKYDSSRTPSATQTVAHNLGSTPEVLLFKNTQMTTHWLFWTKDIATNQHLWLDVTDALKTDSGSFDNTAPNSTVVTINGDARVNSTTDGHTIICYAWDMVQGFSKTGTYTGNGNANGPFVYTGFRPALIILKRTDTAKNWYFTDAKRKGYNNDNPYLSPNLNAAETGGTEVDLLSNGFRITASGTGHNQSGGDYLYVAFAEAPFVNSKGVPCNAR
jgi:hypothetical protein